MSRIVKAILEGAKGETLPDLGQTTISLDRNQIPLEEKGGGCCGKGDS